MVHFSNEQLISLCNLALDEIMRRVGVEAFVEDKRKQLLEASVKRTLEALQREFADALDELRNAKEEADSETGWPDDISGEESMSETDHIADYDLEDCF